MKMVGGHLSTARRPAQNSPNLVGVALRGHPFGCGLRDRGEIVIGRKGRPRRDTPTNKRPMVLRLDLNGGGCLYKCARNAGISTLLQGIRLEL